MEDELDMLFRQHGIDDKKLLETVKAIRQSARDSALLYAAKHEINDPKLLETVKIIRQSARDNALAYAAKHGYVAPPEPKSPMELMEIDS